jgi:hypothetical protein
MLWPVSKSGQVYPKQLSCDRENAQRKASENHRNEQIENANVESETSDVEPLAKDQCQHCERYCSVE